MMLICCEKEEFEYLSWFQDWIFAKSSKSTSDHKRGDASRTHFASIKPFTHRTGNLHLSPRNFTEFSLNFPRIVKVSRSWGRELTSHRVVLPAQFTRLTRLSVRPLLRTTYSMMNRLQSRVKIILRLKSRAPSARPLNWTETSEIFWPKIVQFELWTVGWDFAEFSWMSN